MARSATGLAGLCLLVLGVLSACGANDGQAPEDRPSASTSLSPTRTLPSSTRSADAPAPSKPDSPRPSRSLALPSDTTTSDKPVPGPTSSSTRRPEPAPEPTVRTSTVIAVPAPSSPTPAAEQGEGTAENQAVSPAVWVVSALLALVATVGTWLLVRTRRRRGWLTRLAATRAEVDWFARELIPQLRRSGSIDRVAGGWEVAVPRVAAAEDQLTVLESSAPSRQDAASARQLRDAVRSARGKVETLSGPGRHDEWALDLDDAEALLVAVLGPRSADSASASPPR
jgi:hypothetical protein